MKIVAQTLVRNEENFIWYAINSVLDYVDGMLIYLDDRFNDKTESIIKTIKSSKLVLKKKSPRNLKELGNLRQEMLEETMADWIFVLDGDEVWHDGTISNIKNQISKFKDHKDLVVVPNYMLVGDMFHHQPEEAGRYKIAGRQGNYNIRFIRRDIPGLHVEEAFLREGFVNSDGVRVQEMDPGRIFFSDEKYLHASFLPRSSRNFKKPKYEIGLEIPRDYYFPEVFFKNKPSIVPSPWQAMGLGYKLNAFWQTPLKKLKRKIV